VLLQEFGVNNDILVYSHTLETHVTHLRQVLQVLSDDQWKLKQSKCRFAHSSISYLGHVISAAGVTTDHSFKSHAIAAAIARYSLLRRGAAICVLVQFSRYIPL
jgi:hypothetical protein